MKVRKLEKDFSLPTKRQSVRPSNHRLISSADGNSILQIENCVSNAAIVMEPFLERYFSTFEYLIGGKKSLAVRLF